MKVQKPELNQGESISYSNIWSQGDKTYRNTCPANLAAAKSLIPNYTFVVDFYTFEVG